MVFNERKLPVRLWTEEEYSALLDGLNKFQWGEWKEISTIVKTRTSQQVSNRLLKFSSELPSKNKSQLQIDLHRIAVLKRKEWIAAQEKLKDEDDDSSVPDVQNNDELILQNYSKIWTEVEHTSLSKGLENHGWGEWNEISKLIVTKTPSQVGSKMSKLSNASSTKNHLAELIDLAKQRRWEYKNGKDSSKSISTSASTGSESDTKSISTSTSSESDTSNSSTGSKISKKKSSSSTSSGSVSSPLSSVSVSRKSSVESIEIKNLIGDNFEDEIKPVQNGIESPTTPPPLKNLIDDCVVMDGGVAAEAVTMAVAGTAKGMSIEEDYEKDLITTPSGPITEDITENSEDATRVIQADIPDEATPAVVTEASLEEVAPTAASAKRARKSPTVISKSPKSPKSKSTVVANIPAKKRVYTRKSRAVAAAVSVGEEVSILSSSSSGEFERESINIMSSSSSSSSLSNSNDSIPSVSSEKVSVKSKESSVTSNSSTKSALSNSSVPEWEKAACPAIFMKTDLLNPENRFLMLKKKLKAILLKDPEISKEALLKSLNQDFSRASIAQVLQILRPSSPAASKNGASSGAVEAGETQISADYELLKKLSITSSGRKRKIRSDEGDWIDPNEIEGRVISHDATPVREKSKRKYTKKQPSDGYDGEDLSTTEDPFRLILLSDYHGGHSHSHSHDSEDYEDYETVPFTVEMCSSVILLMDLHSHLHSSEIIGLLGGTLIKTEDIDIPILRIDYGYPCLTAHSTGTQVDVDPLSEMEAGEFFESKNARLTGWYHSHPNFEPNPSLRDLETQTMYQGLFRNTLPGSDIEPFVGVIVNPYLAITESSSHVECFYVAPNPDPAQERLPYRLPIHRKPFHPAAFPVLLERMRETIFRAQSSPDRLDMQRNAEPGVKRIEKLYKSLQFHGELTDEQMEQIKELFK